MDEDEVEMIEEAEVTDNTGDKENTEGDEERETEEDDPYRCKHYRRKCQFVVSFNWFVYNVSVTVDQLRLVKLNLICECCRILCCVIRKRSILDLF